MAHSNHFDHGAESPSDPAMEAVADSMEASITATPESDGTPGSSATERITRAWIERFRRSVFANVKHRDALLDSLDRPAANRLERGMLLWALGRFAESTPLLEAEVGRHPALGSCLADAYVAAKRFDDAERVIASIDDGARGEALLSVAEARGDTDALVRTLEQHAEQLGAADRKYYQGRIKELRHDPEGSIALYDEALALDATHRGALFRLALNVDLRGEDEEARQLYERALMSPPVNAACVMNLGILYEDQGNFRRAMQCFDLVVQAEPGNDRARMYRRDAAASLTMYYDEEQQRGAAQGNRLLRTPIADFELSARTGRCLASMNVRTLGDLVVKTAAELLAQHNIGETTLAEIKEVLRHKGLHLGMRGEDWTAEENGKETPSAEVDEGVPDEASADVRRRPVTALDLSLRSHRVVNLLQIRTIGDLCAKTEAELLSCNNFGQTSLNEIKCKLDELGLALRG